MGPSHGGVEGWKQQRHTPGEAAKPPPEDRQPEARHERGRTQRRTGGCRAFDQGGRRWKPTSGDARHGSGQSPAPLASQHHERHRARQPIPHGEERHRRGAARPGMRGIRHVAPAAHRSRLGRARDTRSTPALIRQANGQPFSQEIAPRRSDEARTGNDAVVAMRAALNGRGNAKVVRLGCSPSCREGRLCHGDSLAAMARELIGVRDERRREGQQRGDAPKPRKPRADKGVPRGPRALKGTKAYQIGHLSLLRFRHGRERQVSQRTLDAVREAQGAGVEPWNTADSQGSQRAPGRANGTEEPHDASWTDSVSNSYKEAAAGTDTDTPKTPTTATKMERGARTKRCPTAQQSHRAERATTRNGPSKREGSQADDEFTVMDEDEERPEHEASQPPRKRG